MFLDIKKSYQMFFYIRLISIVFFSGYALHPFINGVGCNYHSLAKGENVEIYTTCRLGVIDAIAKNSVTGQVVKYKGVYGKSGNTIFMGVVDMDNLHNGSDRSKATINFMGYEAKFFVASVITRGSKDYIVLQSPYYTFYSSVRVGRDAFF